MNPLRRLLLFAFPFLAFFAPGPAKAQESLAEPVVSDEALVMRLESGDCFLRKHSALELGRRKALPALDPLLKGLSDPCEEVRKACARALGEIGSPRALESLTQALRDPRSPIAVEAARALGTMKDPAAIPPLLEAAIRGEGWEFREAASEAVAGFGTRALDRLLRLCEDHSPGTRALAAGALGRIGNPCAVPGLQALLEDPDEDVRGEAAEALGRIGDTHAIPALAKMLSSGKAPWECSWALSRFGEAALAPLIDATGKPDSEIRRLAAIALGGIGGEGAKAVLVRGLRDPDLSVGRTCLFGLKELSPEAGARVPPIEIPEPPGAPLHPPFEWAWRFPDGPPCHSTIRGVRRVQGDVVARRAAAECCFAQGSPSDVEVKDLARAVEDPDREVRFLAVSALHEAGEGDPRAVRALAGALGDPDEAVRTRAAMVLLARGEAHRSLLEFLLHAAETGWIEEEYAQALRWEIPLESRWEPILIGAARSDIPLVRAYSAWATGRRFACGEVEFGWIERTPSRPGGSWSVHERSLASSALPLLLESLRLGDRSVRNCSLWALGELRVLACAAVPAVAQDLRHADRTTRIQAALALVKIDPSSVEGIDVLVASLADPSWAVSRQAMEALAEVGQPALAALRFALTSANTGVRGLAALAIGKMGKVSAPAIQDLEALEGDADPWVRSVAAEALEDIRNAKRG